MADETACTCEPGTECVCDQVAQMISEVDSIKILNKGFRMTIDGFDVGPGAAFSTGEQLVNVYIWPPSGRDLTLATEPAMTLGLPKASAAKLMWGLTQTAKELGWLERDEDEDERD